MSLIRHQLLIHSSVYLLRDFAVWLTEGTTHCDQLEQLEYKLSFLFRII